MFIRTSIRMALAMVFMFCAVMANSSEANALQFDSEQLPTSINNALPPESYQLAKATFLPYFKDSEIGFSGDELDSDYNPKGSCSNKSSLYTKANCTYPRTLIAASRCPFLPGYYTRCECLPKFNLTSCPPPKILGGDSCDGKYEKCVCPATVLLTCPNDTCTKTCEGNCIAKSCTPTANQTGCTNGTKACDDGCCGTTRKCCIPCTDKITTKPANSSYTYCSCTDGDGTKQIKCGCKCNSGYHEKNGTCSNGGICEKDCIVNSCSGYTLTTCPANAICSSCTITAQNCTTDGTKYKITSCKSGYHQSGNSCVAHSYSCPSGYQASACSSSQVQTGTKAKVCSCGATSGTCYTCRAKTCEEKGMKTCNGTCIATSACCGCSSSQVCYNGSCCTPAKPTYVNAPCGCSSYYTENLGCGVTAQVCRKPSPCNSNCNPITDPGCVGG